MAPPAVRAVLLQPLLMKQEAQATLTVGWSSIFPFLEHPILCRAPVARLSHTVPPSLPFSEGQGLAFYRILGRLTGPWRSEKYWSGSLRRKNMHPVGSPGETWNEERKFQETPRKPSKIRNHPHIQKPQQFPNRINKEKSILEILKPDYITPKTKIKS